MSEIWGLALAAAAGSVAGGALSASGSESAAQTAASANLANTQATNAQNLQMFEESRGSTGSAVLPTYFGSGEQNMANAAMGQFNTISNQAQNVYGMQQGAMNSLMPALNSSMTALGNLYNGQNLQQQLGYMSPVYNANLGYAATQGQGLRNVAQANSNAVNTGLAQQLAAMTAQNNNQGFLGSSTFNNNRMMQATIAAQQQGAVGQASAGAQAANLSSAANLGNLQQTQGLQFQNLANMSNPGLLASGIGAYGQAMSSPMQQLSSNYQAAQAPLNFFRIAPQAWQAQNMPTVYPQINGSQIAGGAVNTAASGLSQYMAMNQQQSFMNQLLGNNNMNSMANQVNQISPMFSPQSPYYQSQMNSLAFNPSMTNNSFGTVDPYSAGSMSGADGSLFGTTM